MTTRRGAAGVGTAVATSAPGSQDDAQHSDEVGRLALLDPALVGPGLDAEAFRTQSRHTAFHTREDVPEAVVADEGTPVQAPTLLLTAEGLLEPIRPGVQALTPNLVRAAEVPGTGQWLPEEDPDTVSAELLAFLDRP